jgi:hypothetical protein
MDEAAVQDCISLASTAAPIEASFKEIRYKPGMVYSEPCPAADVSSLCAQARSRWPSCVPYNGKYVDSTPHVTLALGDVEKERSGLQELLSPLMPFRSRFENLHVAAYEAAGWNIARSFPLGAKSSMSS